MEKVIQSFSPEESGWQFMWIILVVGLAGFGVAVERFVYIVLKAAKGRASFMGNIAGLLKAQKYDEATSYAQNGTIPLAKVMYAILSNRDKGESGMQKAMDETYLTEAPRINRYLSIIGVVANVSTLLGLLGTIFGLIYTFDAVANKPAAERPKALADGIAVAMGTTFAGLVIAIPLMGIQGYLMMQAERLVEEMEEKGIKVINILS